ncbi:MAG TPA: hypothetical protein VEX60_03925 [Pyrinomonadaceae bacterium]|nr:hypothetical protein [Pyrinomonadaceae bacterium]
MLLWTLLFIFWTVVPGLITGWMFRERGRRFTPGLILGAACGPFGILAALVFIYVSDRRAARERASKRGRAVRVFYDVPVVGRLHVTTVWALAGVATFFCLWMVGGVAYEIQRAGQRLADDERIAEAATGTLQSNGSPATTSTAAHAADSKPNSASQSSTSSQPQAALLGNISVQPGQHAHAARAENSSPQNGQPSSPNAPGPSNVTSQPEASAPPMPSPTASASATPPGPKAPTQSRESVASEAARDLGSMGHKVHASVSGAGSSTTLSLSGASLTRDAGNRLLGNGRLRQSLKSAGVRIVVVINGQESWTYIL